MDVGEQLVGREVGVLDDVDADEDGESVLPVLYEELLRREVPMHVISPRRSSASFGMTTAC
jgi:hypothetical protein